MAEAPTDESYEDYQVSVWRFRAGKEECLQPAPL